MFHLGYLLLLDQLDKMEAGRPRAYEVLRRARQAGLRTSLDCVSEDSERFQTIVAPVLSEVDVLFANDFEVQKLTGRPLRRNGQLDSHAVTAAARELLAHGVREWVVIQSPEAAYASGPGGEGIWQPSVRVPADEIVGAAGAGDALAAGVLLGMHEAWPMSASLKLGVCAAAASLYHVTCSAGVESVATCHALAGRLGYHSLPT
jgi:sugar/nucleoside kinase (ribokinase family)